MHQSALQGHATRFNRRRTIAAALFSTSTYSRISSMALVLVAALVDPRHLSTKTGTTASRVRAAVSPANLTKAITHSTPFSCATAFASLTIFLKVSGLLVYGRKAGSLSEVVAWNFLIRAS